MFSYSLQEAVIFEEKERRREKEGIRQRRRDDLREEDQRRTGFPRGQEATELCTRVVKETRVGLLRESEPVPRFKLE